MKTVITYGTFDLLHYGHIELLRRAKELAEGGKLIVGLSTDKFNEVKGKAPHMPYGKRKELIKAISYVDQVIPESNWEQKENDIKSHRVDVFVMGNDWAGKFDELKKFCDVVYLERTPTISSTAIKGIIAELEKVEAEAA
ncbi:MAG TPA: adenylyltransferase/cytidyltransferase family protein [Candidatus Saccharimonadales bacterium]|jgi:glycerol-3-phosphate cytidylyltransferase